MSDPDAREQGHDGREHGYARTGAILGHAARGDVDVNVALLEEVLRDAVFFGVGAHVAEGCVGALLHDFTELTGELHLARAEHARRLDEQDFAAHAGPGEASGHTRLFGALRDFTRELDRAQEFAKVVFALDGALARIAFGDFHRHTADHAGHRSLE